MAAHAIEQQTPGSRWDDAIDGAVEDTFQSGDAPATDGFTQIENAAGSDVPGADPDEDVPDEDVPAEPSPGDTPPDESTPQGQS